MEPSINTGFRVKSWKKIYQANGPPKLAGIATLISDKVDLKYWSNEIK
jgi:hypothetical protein